MYSHENERSLGLNLIGIISIMVASSLTIMVGSAVVPAVPAIGEYYKLGDYAGWVITTPALGVIVFSLLAGKLIDKIGSYLAVKIALVAYGVIGVTGFLMPNIFLLLTNRFLLGIATVIVMAGSTDLISKFYTGKERLNMLAIQGMAIELGGVLYLSVSGILAETSWKLSFLIYSIGFVAFILMKFYFPEPKDKIHMEIKKKKDDLKNTNNISIIFLCTFLGMLIFFTAIIYLPVYFQNILGYSTSFTGYYLASISLVAVISAGIMPKIVSCFSANICLINGFLSYLIGNIIFVVSDSILCLAMAAIFLGIGFGLTHALYNNLVVENSNENNQGFNLSLFAMMAFLGQFLSPGIVTLFKEKNIFLSTGILAIIVILIIFFFLNKNLNEKVSY